MDNFTRVPNKIIDEAKLNPYQFQLFSIIVRKTDGWCKVEDGISLSQFEKLVTFKKPKIVSTLKELVQLGLIEKKINYNQETKLHSYSTYKISKRVVTENNNPSNSQLQGVVTEDYIQKKTNTKETKQSDYDIFIEYLKANCKYKTKVSATKDGRELFKQIEDKKGLIVAYIKHQIDKKEFAVRITAFMEDYNTVYKNETTSTNTVVVDGREVEEVIL